VRFAWFLLSLVLGEAEQLEQVTDCGPIYRYVRFAGFRNGVGEVIPATDRNRFQLPVPLDELQNRNVVGVVVGYASTRRELGNHDHRDTRAISEEVQGLHVSGVVVTAAFVKGDEDCGVGPQRFIRFYRVDDLLGEALEQVELGRGGVTVNEATGFNERNGGKLAVGDVTRGRPGDGPGALGGASRRWQRRAWSGEGVGDF